MHFETSFEQKAFREVIRSFAKKEIAPLVDEAEMHQKFPVELFSKMGSLGYLSINCPEEYGGAAASKMMECDYNEEVAFINLGIARGLAIQAYASYYLLHAGSHMQKERYLAPAVQGWKLLAYAATEANAGSDRTRIESVATKTAGGFRLDAHKMYCVNATFADAFLIEAFTDKSKGLRGLTLFLVDRDTKGLSVSDRFDKAGVRACEMAEVILEDCFVPKENQIGHEGRSQEFRRNVLSPSLAVEAAHAVGLARAAFEASLEYSKIRVQFNRPIGHFQGVSFKLADMAVSIDAARLLTHRVAWMADEKMDCYAEGLIAKLFASEMASRVTQEALQIHGVFGFMMESPIQRYFRDAQILTISKGPSNIYRILISRSLGIVADDHYPPS